MLQSGKELYNHIMILYRATNTWKMYKKQNSFLALGQFLKLHGGSFVPTLCASPVSLTVAGTPPCSTSTGTPRPGGTSSRCWSSTRAQSSTTPQPSAPWTAPSCPRCCSNPTFSPLPSVPWRPPSPRGASPAATCSVSTCSVKGQHWNPSRMHFAAQKVVPGGCFRPLQVQG